MLSLRILIVYSFILYLICVYFLVILPLPSREAVAKMTGPGMQLIPFNICIYQVRLTEVRIEQIVSTLAAYPTPVTQNRYCLLVGWKNMIALQSLSSIR